MIDTKTFTRALQDGLPNTFKDEQEAQRAVDVMFSVIPKGLKNGDIVELQGVGEFRTEPEGGKKRVVFAADRRLMDTVNE
ncbi:MAG: HU family DNA-binding protein [Desulfovibrionales bacterium]